MQLYLTSIVFLQGYYWQTKLDEKKYGSMIAFLNIVANDYVSLLVCFLNLEENEKIRIKGSPGNSEPICNFVWTKIEKKGHDTISSNLKNIIKNDFQ